MIKSIFFDYDGVLVDSFINIFKVYKTMCRRFHLKCPKTIENLREIYGYRHQDAYKNIGLRPKQYLEADNIFKREIIKYRPRLFSGTKKLLAILSSRYQLFLVSSTTTAEVLGKLKYYNLVKYFQEIKTDNGPEKYTKNKLAGDLIKKYHLQKQNIIFIGDRSIDYDSALQLKLPLKNILIVEYGWGYDHQKIKMKYKIRRPLDLLKTIEKIDKR